MLAVIAALVFVVGLVLKLADASLGRFDWSAWLLLGLVFLALHAAFNWWPKRPA